MSRRPALRSFSFACLLFEVAHWVLSDQLAELGISWLITQVGKAEDHHRENMVRSQLGMNHDREHTDSDDAVGSRCLVCFCDRICLLFIQVLRIAAKQLERFGIHSLKISFSSPHSETTASASSTSQSYLPEHPEKMSC